MKCSDLLLKSLAKEIAEGLIDVDTENEWLETWQHLIDTGQCWTLEPWFGKIARHLIREGICHE